MNKSKEQDQRNPQAQPGQAAGQDKSEQQPDAQQEHGGQPGASSDIRGEQRTQKENQMGQLSAADQQQSPRMDRGESGGGSGESVRHGAKDAQHGADSSKSAKDAQYGTDSSKSGQGQQKSPQANRLDQDGKATKDSNPGISEKSAGSERDTMAGSRDGGRS